MVDHLRIEDTPGAEPWNTDEPTLRRWSELVPGEKITVVKRSAKYDGEERARYPGSVVATTLPAPWVEIEARWTLPPHTQANLTFEPGDVLRETYSPIHPFDAFAVYTPTGEFKGWYANVAYPAVLECDRSDLILVWHDLFVDIVATPDGEVAVLDEDELAESGMAERDPELHARVLAARDELLQQLHDRRPPFHRSDITPPR